MSDADCRELSDAELDEWMARLFDEADHPEPVAAEAGIVGAEPNGGDLHTVLHDRP